MCCAHCIQRHACLCCSSGVCEAAKEGDVVKVEEARGNGGEVNYVDEASSAHRMPSIMHVRAVHVVVWKVGNLICSGACTFRCGVEAH